jgi:hypothetical protein
MGAALNGDSPQNWMINMVNGTLAPVCIRGIHMTVLCAVLGHTPSTMRKHNQGLAFTLCHHCGCDLIRGEDDAWKPVPKGFKVTWKSEPRALSAAAVADRIHLPPPPRRRDPRGARPTPRRDPRGRPFAGAGSLVSLFANLGELVGERQDDVLTVPAQPVICLPSASA